MNYSTPRKRPLREEEKLFLKLLFQNSKTDWLKLLDQLTVIARCGCNNCPTILLGLYEGDQTLSNQPIVAELTGSDMNNEPIEVVLFGNDIKPTELEFISYGSHNLTELAPFDWFIQQANS